MSLADQQETSQATSSEAQQEAPESELESDKIGIAADLYKVFQLAAMSSLLAIKYANHHPVRAWLLRYALTRWMTKRHMSRFTQQEFEKAVLGTFPVEILSADNPA